MKRSTLFGLLALLCLPACEAPRFEGPMVQALPSGFIREPDARQDHEVFPDREALTLDAYVVFADMDFGGIYIRKHAGGTVRQDVEAARAAAAALEAADGVRYGDIELLRVDGQVAWGWMEERHDVNGLQAMEYRAVIPYADSVTYTVEFTSAKYNLITNPDSLRFVTTSFSVGKVEWDYPLIGILTLVGVLVFSATWNKVSVKDPTTSYALLQIPVPESQDDEEPAAPASPDARSGGPKTGPHPPGGA